MDAVLYYALMDAHIIALAAAKRAVGNTFVALEAEACGAPVLVEQTSSQMTSQGPDNEKNKPANALHAFSHGALFGLIVAG